MSALGIYDIPQEQLSAYLKNSKLNYPTPISAFWEKVNSALPPNWLDRPSRNAGMREIDNDAHPNLGDRYSRSLRKKFLPNLPVELQPLATPDIGGLPTGSSIEMVVMLDVFKGYVGDNVLEIGGGYGGLARAVLNYKEGTRYWIADLPEEGCIQARYLSRCDRHVTLYPNIAGEVVILPGGALDELARRKPDLAFNLVINTRSFMELDPPCLEFYYDKIQKLTCKGSAFYNLNRDKCVLVSSYPWRKDSWSVVLRQQWKVHPAYVEQIWKREV